MKGIRLTKARTFELDPKKAYLLFLKKGAISEEEALKLAKSLKSIGIVNAVVALTEKNAYKVIEAEVAVKKAAKQISKQVKGKK